MWKTKKNTLAFALEFPACRSNNANSTSWPPMRAEARRTEPSRMWPIWTWAKRRSFEGILGHVTGLLMCQFLNLGHEMNMMHFLGSLWSLWIFMDLYGSLWIFPVSPSSSASKNHGGMSLGPSPGCPAQTKGAPKMLGSWGRKNSRAGIQQGWC